MATGFGDLAPTGRRVKGPIFDLIELSGGDARWTAVVYQEDFRDDPALDAGLSAIRTFIDMPMVDGLLGLSHHPEKSGCFVYKTGVVRTVRELTSIMGETGGAGARAGT